MKRTAVKFFAMMAAVIALCMTSVMLACADKADAEKYTLTFSANGEVFAEVTAEAGAQISDPGTPTSDDGTFEGWYLTSDCSGDKQVVPSVMPGADVTYYAKFVKYAKLSVSGAEYSQEYDVAVGTDVAEFLADKTPALAGAEFGGYFTNGMPLAGGTSVPASGLEVTVKFFVEYTVRAYKQNTLGGYPTKPEESKAKGFIGEALTAADINVEHFTPDEQKTQYITPALGGENIQTVYLARNTYSIIYNSNAPQDADVVGTVEPSSALYELPVTVKANGYEIAGYRFAGWSLTTDGELTEDYEAQSQALLDGDVVLYAQWDKGYVDCFGGSDIIYLPRTESDKVYLEREGLEEKCGEYNAANRTFVFTHGDGELSGKIAADGTFAYYGDENPGTYKHIRAYDSSLAADGATLVLDNYNGATLKTSDGDYAGVYAVDEESGDFVFTCADAPEEYKSFYFTLGTYNMTGELAFAIRGDEYGMHYSYDADGTFVLPIMILDGYGTAAILTSSSTRYGMYDFAEDYATSKEIAIDILAYSSSLGYYISETVVCRLDGRTTAVNTATGEQTEVGLFTVRDNIVGKYTAADGSGTVVVLDGYGAGLYGNDKIAYTANDVIVEFTLSGARKVIKLDTEAKTFDANIGSEQGSYYLYIPHENMPYTTTLYLDGQGNAEWTIQCEYSSNKRVSGAYEYDAVTGYVTCTYDGTDYVFRVSEINWRGGKYKVYVQKVTLDGNELDGEFVGEKKLTLDGYGYATYGVENGTYALEKRDGYTETFIVFYNNGNIIYTFKADTEARTVALTDYAVGQYTQFAYDHSSNRFLFGNYALILKENGAAEIYGKQNSWDVTFKRFIGNGSYAYSNETASYTFTPDAGVDFDEFEFILTQSGNGTRVYKAFDELLAPTYSTEDGTGMLVFDGYGNAEYIVNGVVIVSSEFEYLWGTYTLTVDRSDGVDESYKFTVYEKGGQKYFVLAGSEARIYTLYDPMGAEKQQMIIDGNGNAELYRYSADDERYESAPFVTGTYEHTERDGEWKFVSADKRLSPDFNFILPETTQIISFMKYNENADGRFDCSDWTVLLLDGYCGHYTGARYIERNGIVHTGTYTTEGEVIVFTDSTSGEFYLKLIADSDTFKRLGDERGDYAYYVPITGALYSQPSLFLDGEGGATLNLSATVAIEGAYSLYGDSRTEYVFAYTDDAGEVTFRFRTSASGTRKTFLLHNEAADGIFAGADGRLEVDGYYNAVYTDADGVEWSGYYVSADEIPLSNEKDYLVTFVGLKDGGSSDNESDIAMFACIISHDGSTFKKVSDEAAFYYEYKPSTMGVYSVRLLLDGDGNAYLQNPDNGGAYDKGTYEIDLDAGEGTYTIDGVTNKFRLTVIQTSMSSSTMCFIRYDELWAGTYTSDALGTLELDGYGEAVYTDANGNESYGILTMYETSYITDPTVVLTVVVNGYSDGELYFKLDRAAKTFKAAGEEVNYYYGYKVDSIGGTYNASTRLLLDGDGKAELFEADAEGNLVSKACGVYTVKSTVTEGNSTTVTYTFTPNDNTESFDFQFRYIQEYYMGGYVPCYAKYDAVYNGAYTGTTVDAGGETVTHTLTLNGYELATYEVNGETYTGTYTITYTDGRITVKFTARDEKGASYATATFIVSNDDGKTLTVVSALAAK